MLGSVSGISLSIQSLPCSSGRHPETFCGSHGSALRSCRRKNRGQKKQVRINLRTCFRILLMAFLAFHRAKSHLTVVTASAEFALVYVIHLHPGAALFKLEDSGVAVIAIEHSGMKRMAEDRRILAGGGIGDFFFKTRSSCGILCSLSRRRPSFRYGSFRMYCPCTSHPW